MKRTETNVSILARAPILGVGRNILVLGLVSLLTDMSSDMIFTLLPLYLANILGAQTAVIGFIEGLADASGSILRVVSGRLSDLVGKRKALTVLGYGLSTLSKPFFYLAGAWSTVLGLRFLDRVGKGIRSAPRDALIADSSPADRLGRSFGFHSAMDTLGAFLGILAAVAIVFLLQRGSLVLEQETFKIVVLVGTVPAVLAVLLLMLLVRERHRANRDSARKSGALFSVSGLDKRLWAFLGIMVLFTVGASSEATSQAFILLRSQNLGLSVVQILLLFALFNLVYAASSMPAGILSDTLGRKGLLAISWGLLGLTFLGFAVTPNLWLVPLLFATYGLYLGMSKGVSRALIADYVSQENRGAAFGMYYTAVGLAALPAGVLAGFLWQAISPAAPFFFGAAVSAASVALLWRFTR